tara:strand:- start:312 stop:896 length:585 start_codon:yes stop_codon:yes gene_type:complete
MELLKRKTLIKISLLSMLFMGCGFYSLKGSLPGHIKTISIAPIINESSEFGINDKINEIILDKFISENILDITNDDIADSRLNIIVKRVDNNPYTYTVQSNVSYEQVEEYRIVIHANVIWYDLTKDELLLESNKSAWGAYGTGLDISNDLIDNDGDGLIDSEDDNEFGSPKETAILLAMQKLSEDIINELTSTW